MAVFNEIDEGGLNAILTRRLGMPGGSPAPSLAPEIMPQMALEVDRPEWGWLKGEQLLSWFQNRPAGGVGNRVQNWFTNPTGSGLIAVVSRITAFTGNLSVRVLRAIDAGAIVGTIDPSVPRDLRWASGGGVEIRYATLPSPVATYQVITDVASGSSFEDPLIISPGTTLHVQGRDNAATGYSIVWSERNAQLGELV